MTFASAGGRYQVWSFRLAALALTCAACCGSASLLTYVFITRDLPPVAAALHALVPLVFVATLTVFLSVLFNGGASAALVTAGVLALSALVVHPFGFASPEFFRRVDLFVNPFDPPQGLLDPRGWFRILVFNRSLFIVATGLWVAGTLWLLQRRERLL